MRGGRGIKVAAGGSPAAEKRIADLVTNFRTPRDAEKTSYDEFFHIFDALSEEGTTRGRANCRGTQIGEAYSGKKRTERIARQQT